MFTGVDYQYMTIFPGEELGFAWSAERGMLH